MTAPAASTPSKPSALRAILAAGFVAGALDIGYVMVMIYSNTGDPARIMRMLRSIAAGLLGANAVKDGSVGLSLLGLGLHFLIACGAAAVFYAASRMLPMLTRHVVGAIGSGLAYGMVVWLVMNYVVLPLDANPPKAVNVSTPIILAHLFCVGLPIALIVRKLAPVPPPAAA
jgi:hypothetical protein